MLKPRPLEELPYDASRTLRKAYEPIASTDERSKGERLLYDILMLVKQTACEGKDVLIGQLIRIGMPRWAAKIIAYLFNKIC